jgi:hypothetical protein
MTVKYSIMGPGGAPMRPPGSVSFFKNPKVVTAYSAMGPGGPPMGPPYLRPSRVVGHWGNKPPSTPAGLHVDSLPGANPLGSFALGDGLAAVGGAAPVAGPSSFILEMTLGLGIGGIAL